MGRAGTSLCPYLKTPSPALWLTWGRRLVEPASLSTSPHYYTPQDPGLHPLSWGPSSKHGHSAGCSVLAWRGQTETAQPAKGSNPESSVKVHASQEAAGGASSKSGLLPAYKHPLFQVPSQVRVKRHSNPVLRFQEFWFVRLPYHLLLPTSHTPGSPGHLALW